MEYRKWYDREIKTSLLGYGAMRLKTDENGEIDEQLGFELFDKAYKNGVNYFDTAYPYTNKKNETFVGKALKRYPRESFYLATKLSLGMFKTKEEALASLDYQLKCLQTDYVDNYLLHAMNKKYLALVKEWDLIPVLEQYKKEGKIRNIGFSFHDDYDTFMELLDLYKWDFCQIQLNYMDTEIQQGLKGYYELEKRHIPVIIMEPCKGGKLANFNPTVSKLFTEYNPNRSIASWAFRYLGTLPGIKVILSGMNSMDQLDDNLKTFDKFEPLNDEEQTLVKKVSEELRKITKVGCTACRYCMPCPKGVDIPGTFSIYNTYAMYLDKGGANWSYSFQKKNNATADNCVKCRACVAKCPQGIDIPNEFVNFYKDLDFLEK